MDTKLAGFWRNKSVYFYFHFDRIDMIQGKKSCYIVQMQYKCQRVPYFWPNSCIGHLQHEKELNTLKLHHM